RLGLELLRFSDTPYHHREIPVFGQRVRRTLFWPAGEFLSAIDCRRLSSQLLPDGRLAGALVDNDAITWLVLCSLLDLTNARSSRPSGFPVLCIVDAIPHGAGLSLSLVYAAGGYARASSADEGTVCLCNTLP